MNNQGLVLSSIKFVTIEIIGDILYFPIWWYTRGAKKSFLFFWNEIVATQKGLGVGIWIKNLFRPMFAQADWQGKIISFLMRVAQIIIRSIALVFWTVILLVAFFAWLVLPIFIIYQIYQVLINIR